MTKAYISPKPIDVWQLRLDRTPRVPGGYWVLWMKKGIVGLQVDDRLYPINMQAAVFLRPDQEWSLQFSDCTPPEGYFLRIDAQRMHDPQLQQLLIYDIQLFHQDTLPMILLSPGIAQKGEVLIDLIEELHHSTMKGRDQAITSLLHAFFVFCDSNCNIQSIVPQEKGKGKLVFEYKKIVAQHFAEAHDVSYYAEQMNVSAKYLNSVTQEVLGVNAKHVIQDRLIIRARQFLEFSDLSVKEIAYELGFSAADYFSSFFRKMEKCSPSSYRKRFC